MATYSRQLLSGSTNGKPVKIAATATPGTTIHTAVSGTSSFDEIYAWLTNTDGSARTATIEFGTTTSPDGHLIDTLSLPANSPPIPIITGQVLQNSLVCGVFASVTNVVLATGFVNRIA
jgi:hypothetical protein